MRERSQFLLVTHNRQVIERVDRLVGVTQEEKGVTKLVAVQLDEAVEQARAGARESAMLEEMLIVAAMVLAPFALYGLYAHLRRAPAPKPAGRKTVSPPPREAGQEPAFTPEEDQQYDPSSFVDDELKPTIVRSPGAPAPAAPAPESQPAPEPQPPAAPAPPAVAADDGDEFPPLDGSKLQELYYYLVRMQFKQGIDATAIHQLATSIEDEVRLRRHQTVLGYSRKSGQWETPRPGNSYRELVWGVPVCNRASKLGGDALPQLVRAIQA